MSVAPKSVVDAAQAAFMQGGVSISAASCGARPFPSVCRALACSVSEDRRLLTVVVARSCAQELLDDVGHSGRIAVVFSQPSTHRTIQVKGDHARPGMPDASLVVIEGGEHSMQEDTHATEIADLIARFQAGPE